MPNHLVHENSPYLLQHAHNPVDWYPWGPEALEQARREDKPIFLSIGYAACHWCHVMAHESFEDADTAALMNANFVNIKVDREERPDLDALYMQAVVTLTGSGGWPMSVFLTPDGKPFYGGTYFPPVRRYQMPAFREVLQTIARVWRSDRPRLIESSQQLSRQLQSPPALGQSSAALDEAQLHQAVLTLAQAYDWQHGGWGGAPKFPQPMTIEFLLRQAGRRQADASTRAQAGEMAVHALRAMARGGMYDVVGGGFARYATDNTWRTPHFEKMLSDNAQLARVYLHAWLATGDPDFRRVCEETLDFILREMTHPRGGFYSSLDADSEGEEGKYYLWSVEAVQQALSHPQQAALLIAAYGLTASGKADKNHPFEGQNTLQRVLSEAQLAEQFDLPLASVPGLLQAGLSRLRAVRQARQRPATDDKVLTAWNALMLTAFAEAGRSLHRQDYLAAAQRNAHFLLATLRQEGRLLRSWRDDPTGGRARHNAYLEDYAALGLALLALYQSDADIAWYRAALELTEVILARFSDPEGGFFDTSDDHETLLIRPKELQDNATPSGGALAAALLLQLAAYEGQSAWRQKAEATLAQLQAALARYPTAFAQWLCAADFALGPVDEVAVVGPPDHPHTGALWQTLWMDYRPRQVAAMASHPPPPGSPALLQDRPLLNGLPTAYVCRNFTCRQPVNLPEQLHSILDGAQ